MRHEIFSVADAFGIILNPELSPHRRALKLYELQIAISVFWSRPGGHDPADYRLSVPAHVLRWARLFVARQILNCLERRANRENRRPYDDPTWREIYDAFQATGGDEALQHEAPRASAFDACMKERRLNQRSVARMLGIVYGEGGPNGRTKTECIEIACETRLPGRRVRWARSKMIELLDRYEAAGPLLYVIYVQKFYILRPLNVSATGFVSKLLSRVNDQAMLLELLEFHNGLADHIGAGDDRFPHLLNVASRQPVFDTLPQDVPWAAGTSG